MKLNMKSLHETNFGELNIIEANNNGGILVEKLIQQ